MRPRSECIKQGSSVNAVLNVLQHRPDFSSSLVDEGSLPPLLVMQKSAPRNRRRLFIELEQRGSKGGWQQTHHWNWAFAQEAEGDGTWRRPHLPIVSAVSLMMLHEGLTKDNVLLDQQASGPDPDLHSRARSWNPSWPCALEGEDSLLGLGQSVLGIKKR